MAENSGESDFTKMHLDDLLGMIELRYAEVPDAKRIIGAQDEIRRRFNQVKESLSRAIAALDEYTVSPEDAERARKYVLTGNQDENVVHTGPAESWYCKCSSNSTFLSDKKLNPPTLILCGDCGMSAPWITVN